MVSHFGAVDELIQLIYQGSNKFVLISAVSSSHWTLHLGLNGAGRWWKGKWSERDIFKFLGNTGASNKLVEMFAERLADNIVKGELFIGNWNAEQGSDITLTLNPSAKSPVHIPLEEMEPKEAAAYAVTMLSEASLFISSSDGDKKSSSSRGETQVGYTKIPIKPIHHEPSLAEMEQAGQKITELKAELAKAQQEVKEVQRRAETSDPDSRLASRAKTVATNVRHVKGASLANPNKKARRFEAMEFDD
ncbi:hypothetical protein BDY19DRAFT_990072 [Irpex rosettiformis]|uniref:Uncharacterized protein n=1 Tax=Irpex rosettiformis TaxID=378272 RepID=A0ACB8UGY6_9APHY|nr:hypothetical protein BDY19DRAFT_990072 [Irpex rosettiformis]